MKICKYCHKEKDESEFYFYRSKHYKDGLCKKCRNTKNKGWRLDHVESEHYERIKLLKEGKNICFICKEVKPLNAFKKTKHTKIGYHNTCIECRKITTKNNNLKRYYNITLDVYNNLYESQSGKCAICQTELLTTNRQTCVDHDHITGKIRGLICNKCNRAMGLLGDNIFTLYSAIKYLKKCSV